jgi:hypothetical protein
MFKGQQLFVAPVFILWPLLGAKPHAALRWAIGFLLAGAAVISPWMLTYVANGLRVIDQRALAWVIGVALSIPALVMLWRCKPLPSLAADIPPPLPGSLPWKPWARWTFLGAVPWYWLPVPCAAGALVLLLTRLPRCSWPLTWAAAVAAALLLCGLIFHGSFNCLTIGLFYGAHHYPIMTMGVPDNLAAILNKRYAWHAVDIALTWPLEINMRQFLCGLYVLAFIPCVIGMALHYRRNDARFLVAATAPWVMLFTFLPQIHERYLLWAAGIGCTFTAVSVAMTFLDLFFTALTCMMTLWGLLYAGDRASFATDISPEFADKLFNAISPTHPDSAWAMLLCAAIFLYNCRDIRKRPEPGS